MVMIDCDSVYVLNKKTFAIYRTAYDKLKGRDANIKQAFNTYESLVQLQEKRIEEQASEYKMLKVQFDSLAVSSGKFIDKTGNRLSDLTTIMNSVNTNLNAALSQINSAQTSIKSEKRKKVKSAITWATGGFALGLITCLLIK